MDHQEKHHQEHRKEREREIHNHPTDKESKTNTLPFHPAWLVVVGTVLVLLAMAIWTMLV